MYVCIKCLTIIQIELEFDNVGFGGDGKAGVPGEKPRSKEEDQQQTQPTYDAGSGNRTRAGTHWWEATLLPRSPALLLNELYQCVASYNPTNIFARARLV